MTDRITAPGSQWRTFVMTGAADVSSTEIYEAVMALSRSISGRTDLRSCFAGVAESSCANCQV